MRRMVQLLLDGRNYSAQDIFERIKPISIGVDTFESDGKHHGRVLQIQQTHAAQLLGAMVYEVEQGKDLSFSVFPFLDDELTAYRRLLFDGVRQTVVFCLQCCQNTGYVGVVAAEEGEFSAVAL